MCHKASQQWANVNEAIFRRLIWVRNERVEFQPVLNLLTQA